MKPKYEVGNKLFVKKDHGMTFPKGKILTIIGIQQDNDIGYYSYTLKGLTPESGWVRQFIENPAQFELHRITNWKERIQK